MTTVTSENVDQALLERIAEESRSFLDRLLEKIGNGGAATVFGAPVERDGLTVIPVAKAAWGFGGGTGFGGPARQQQRGNADEADDEDDEAHAQQRGRRAAQPGFGGGAGGGGGVTISPVGYIELANGRSRFRPIVQVSALMPPLVAVGIIAVLLVRSLRACV